MLDFVPESVRDSSWGHRGRRGSPGLSGSGAQWTRIGAAQKGQESWGAPVPGVDRKPLCCPERPVGPRCLWSLSRNSAGTSPTSEGWSFIAAITTFQMHYFISTQAKSPDRCLKSEVSDLSGAVVDFGGRPLPHPPSGDFSYFFHLHLTKQHNGLKVCLVPRPPLSRGDGKHSVAGLKWLQAASLGGY